MVPLRRNSQFNSPKTISQWKTAYVSQTVTADIDTSAFVRTSLDPQGRSLVLVIMCPHFMSPEENNSLIIKRNIKRDITKRVVKIGIPILSDVFEFQLFFLLAR